MDSMDYDSLTEEELEALKNDLGAQKEAIRDQMRAVDCAWSKKIQMRNIQAKLTEGEMCALGLRPARVEVDPIAVGVKAE